MIDSIRENSIATLYYVLTRPATLRSTAGVTAYLRRLVRITLHGKRFGLTRNAIDSCALLISQHVLGETVYGESPPCCCNVRAIGATAGTDNTELTYSRWMVPPEDKCLSWSQIRCNTAHFADMPQQAFGAIHDPSAASRNRMKRPTVDVQPLGPTSLLPSNQITLCSWILRAPADGSCHRDTTHSSDKNARC